MKKTAVAVLMAGAIALGACSDDTSSPSAPASAENDSLTAMDLAVRSANQVLIDGGYEPKSAASLVDNFYSMCLIVDNMKEQRTMPSEAADDIYEGVSETFDDLDRAALELGVVMAGAIEMCPENARYIEAINIAGGG